MHSNISQPPHWTGFLGRESTFFVCGGQLLMLL